MKKIGIVGGVGWPSTVDYYSLICRRSERWHLTPEMSIESLDLNKAVSYLGVDGDEESWVRFDDYHRAALRRLGSSGAEFALMASNSPHRRFASIVRGMGIPSSICLTRWRRRALESRLRRCRYSELR